MSRPQLPPLSHSGCASPLGPAPLLADAGLDTAETQMLDLIRLDFARRADQAPRHAATPEEVACRMFGTAKGPRILGAISRAVDAMACARGEVFRYTSPFCTSCARRITPEETHLMQVLHHQRRGHRGRAMIHALMICEAGPIAPVIETTAELAILSRNLLGEAAPAAQLH